MVIVVDKRITTQSWTHCVLRPYADQGTFQDGVTKLFWVSLLAIFLDFTPFVGVGDTWSTGTRQVANSIAIIYPLLIMFCRCSRVTSNAGQLDSAIRRKRKEGQLPVSSTATSCLSRYVSLFFLSFFFNRREGAEEWRDIVWEDVGCVGATACFMAPRCQTPRGKAARLHRHDKKRSKNDFTRHPTPHTTRPTCHGIRQPYQKQVPLLSWGLPKLRV
jgi:hypothetical protein